MTYALVGAAIGGGIVILGGIVKALSAAAANDPSAKLKGSPLHDAAAAGDENQVRAAIEAASDVDIANEFGFTPLNVAAWCAHSHAVAQLLKAGASVSATDRANANSLHHAFLGHDERREQLGSQSTDMDLNELERTIQHLVDADIDVNAVSPLGSTPLHGAVFVGSETLTKALVNAGADVNGTGTIDCTPLAMAVAHDHAGTLAVLLELGADARLPAPEGLTLRELAKQSGAGSEVMRLIEAADHSQGS